MFFHHVFEESLAQSSYIIGCQREGIAAVIDPKRDVDTYLEIVKENGLKITHILETHIHADFLSGSRELAELTGAKLYLSDEGGPGWQYEFPHVGLKHGDKIKLGNVQFEVLHTPGHTPESISFLLTDLAASEQPVMFFTGDFIFVGDIGRPDLLEKAAGFEGTQEPAAHTMYQSLRTVDKIAPEVLVWPGHGAGSACGKALSGVPVSTIGYERKTNWAFRFDKNEKGFVNFLLADQPEPPAYFAQMKRLNKVPRPLITTVPVLKALGAEEVRTALKDHITLVDTRDRHAFAQGHVPGSINIQHKKSFTSWAGSLLSYEQPFMLLAAKEEVEELTRKLMRIGLDNVLGYVEPSLINEITNGHPAVMQRISVEELGALKKGELEIVDVRGASEYQQGHIPGAKHLYLGTLTSHIDAIDPNKKVVVYCYGGDRSTIASSLLQRHGLQVMDFSGGMKQWKKVNGQVNRPAAI